MMKKSQSTNEPKNTIKSTAVRLDRWLWACRFYKTRAIAKAAIEGGKIQYQGLKPKPSKQVMMGDLVKLRLGFDEKIVLVMELSDRRQSASIAQKLYQETEQSLKKRLETTQLRKLAAPSTQGKPDKKQRRQIHRFKRQENQSEQLTASDDY